VRLEGLGKLKKIHLIGTRSRYLPACSLVPQLHYGVHPLFRMTLKINIKYFTKQQEVAGICNGQQ
jgi:hypothetical protein